MKICKIIIKGFQQFQDFELDMTYPKGHPKEGEPLEKVCLIGSNGTGKSTLLRILKNALLFQDRQFLNRLNFLILEVQNEINEKYYFCFSTNNNFSRPYLLKKTIDEIPNWIELIQAETGKIKEAEWHRKYELDWGGFLKTLILYAPAESQVNGYNFQGVPNVTLNDSLKLFENFSNNHFPSCYEISADTIKEFWKLLIYLIKKRENDFNEFQNKEENLDKTIRQVQDEFDKLSPKILDGIAILWDKILDKAGLEFDIKNASNPIQLNDNLHAYIKIKGTDKTLPYSELSTGIRNFIFRVGHIYALYFNRDIQRGFLLLDEPENSLYPDFLYDLIDLYTGIIKNTQFITATHNPIIAAQFEPYERFLLEFDDEGTVHAKRGITPIGDDPNDILEKDFGVRNILGAKGIEKWERYIELKRLIKKEENPNKKTELLEEFMKIGNDYNFSV